MGRSRALNIQAPTPRPRQRPAVNGPTPKMLEDAKAYYTANKTKNAASAAENKAKKALHKDMIKGNVSEFEFTGEYNGSSTPMKAVISEDVVEVMDVEKLKALVSDEDFMKIISATKTAVTEIAGEHIVMQCATELTKPASLKLKKAE